MDKRPTFAMISTDIRRDLLAPLRAFRELRIVHFYRKAPYNDLTAEDLADQALVPYASPDDLARKLADARPDIIQNVELFTARQFPYVWAVYRYARRRGLPLVAGVHMSVPLQHKYGLGPALLLRAALAPVLRYTRLFFYLNNGGLRNLRWMGAPQDRLVRHMYGTWGIDPEEFTPQRSGKEPNWGAGPVLLFVGRIHPEKGILDLLEAYGQVRESQPNTRLVLIGEGPLQADAQRSVETLGWQDKVRFLGTVKHRDLPPCFRAGTVFVSPAVHTRKWEEYVGMTNLQAMASGLPVVSTRSGAIPEYVPETAGLLAPEKDPPALAQAILKLLSEPDLRRGMGAAGRAYAAEHYDASKNVQQAEAMILERVGRRLASQAPTKYDD